jgi:MFS transporter, PPP family, 3-phenylpropionic acid transporter
VLALLFFGVSGILASYVWGFGGKVLYLSIATMSFLGAVFGLILYKIYRKKSIDIEGVGRWIIV